MSITTPLTPDLSTGEELAALGWEINANQYRVVHLAARFEEELDWFRRGHKSASGWIASQLEIQTPTAAEWIRVGHALRYLPLIDAAFAAQEISYAKARILTRWADEDNEARLLELARTRSAGRLTVAIAKALADEGETDAERDRSSARRAVAHHMDRWRRHDRDADRVGPISRQARHRRSRRDDAPHRTHPTRRNGHRRRLANPVRGQGWSTQRG